jgi:hypothetical protein
LETIGFGRSPIKRNFVPDIVMRTLHAFVSGAGLL